MNNEIKSCIFNIQRFSIHDGPGIRTTVFFKGCPLNCMWCSNPESQSFKPEPIWDKIKKDYIITGECKTVEEIMEIILKDMDYYIESEGGVTLSGGEVLSHPEFAAELLKECKKHNIHTACETSAFSSPEIFNSLSMALATMSREANSSRSSYLCMNFAPFFNRSFAPSPRTASEIRNSIPSRFENRAVG